MTSKEASLRDALSSNGFGLDELCEFLNHVITLGGNVWKNDEWTSEIHQVAFSRAVILGKLLDYRDWLSVNFREHGSIDVIVRLRVEWLRRSLSCTCGALAANDDGINVLSDLSLVLMS
jgi:hypothetical protein